MSAVHTWQDFAFTPRMVDVPPGSLTLSDGRQLRVNRPFAIGQFALTFEEYDRYCTSASIRRADDAGWGRGTLPAINLSWFDACAYVQWLTSVTGRKFRLPSAIEWEFAACGGDASAAEHGRPDLKCANFLDTPGYGTYPVHSFGRTSSGFTTF